MAADQATGSSRRRGAGRESKRDLAYREIRELIMAGELAPDSKLNLRTLADRLGMSVMPIRDALRSLEAEGLVKASDHRGARVASVSREEILEIVGLRMWLETDAVVKSAQRQDAESLEQAERALAEGAQALKAEKSLDFTQANRRFHEAVEQPGEVSAAIVGDLWDRLWQIRRHMSLFALVPEQMAVAHREHNAILEAVRRGDPQAAKAAMEAHRLSTVQAWTDALDRMPAR
jgi:DNA-binding GntR family transcriptional regulator